jgi:hypothetical protein
MMIPLMKAAFKQSAPTGTAFFGTAINPTTLSKLEKNDFKQLM